MQLENPTTRSRPLTTASTTGSGQYGQIRRLKREQVSLLLIGTDQPHLLKEATRLGWLSSHQNTSIRFATMADVANLPAVPFDFVLCQSALADCITLMPYAKQGLFGY